MKRFTRRVSFSLAVLSVAATAFFGIKLWERNQLLDALIESTVVAKNLTDEDDTAIALAKEIRRRTDRGLNPDDLDTYSRLESTSFFNVTTAVALKYRGHSVIGHEPYGPCGTMSRVLLNSLWKLDIPARKLQLEHNELGRGGGHTMIEFFDDGKWRVLSPADAPFVWRNAKGEVATAEEIQNDHAIFAQVYEQDPNYQYLFDNYQHIAGKNCPIG